MADPDAITKMIDPVTRSVGPVDLLVSSAGVQRVARVEDFPPQSSNIILALDLSASFHATRAVLPERNGRGFARTVNVAASADGLVASRFEPAYVAPKHGLADLAKVVALEPAERGVTCNAICLGYVWTSLVKRQVESQARARGISRDAVNRQVFAEHPRRRFARVKQIAAAVAFLRSEDAAPTTGAALPVDGG